MSIRITGNDGYVVDRVQNRLDTFYDCSKSYENIQKKLVELRAQNVALTDTLAHEDSFQKLLSQYREAASTLKTAAQKLREKTNQHHIHSYFKCRESITTGAACNRDINWQYKEYLEGIHQAAKSILEIDYETPIFQAQNESQRRKKEAQATIEFSLIDQTFPSCSDTLIKENPDEYLRQAALYQNKLLEKKDGTAALVFGASWIKNLPKEATWQQVENMSLMMLEAAKTNENTDLSQYRVAVEQWSKEHPLSENPDPNHLTPAQATTPWGRRTYILGSLYLNNRNLDLSPEALRLYQNCSFLYPDEHHWKIAQAYYHTSELQCIEAEQLLAGLPKDDPSVMRAQKYLNEVKAEKEFSLIDQTFPSSRDRLLQETPAEYLRQAALYQHKLLEKKDGAAALVFGTSWIKNLPKEATWEQVEGMSFMMLEAAKTNENADLSQYRIAVDQWLKEHPLSENPDPNHLTPAQATTPWGRRTYILGLLYLTNRNLDLSPEALQLYQNCGFLYPDEHLWKVAQAYYHTSELQCIEAEQLLAGLPKDDPLVTQAQKCLKEAKAEKELSLIDQTFPNCRVRLLQETPAEYLRQAALYQHKLLKEKDGTAALVFGTFWIKNLPKEATWQQVEDMSFMMLEAAKINENADLSEYRTAVEQWSKEHPLSENPDLNHLTPAQATTPWGRRTYTLGSLYLTNRNLDLSPEVLRLYQNCSFLYPDEHFWKVAQAFYHISKLQWLEAKQVLADLPKDDISVRKAQKCLADNRSERICSVGLDLGVIAFSRLVPASFRETPKFDVIHMFGQWLTNSSVRKIWLPRLLRSSEPSISIRHIPLSLPFTLAGDVIDVIFRHHSSVRRFYIGESLASTTLRTANMLWSLYLNPGQRSVPSVINIGSSLISVGQGFAEWREIRRPAAQQAVLSTIQLMISDLSTTITLSSYTDLLPLIGVRPQQIASQVGRKLFTAQAFSNPSQTEETSKMKWFLAAGVGSLAAYRFYFDYPYLWAAGVMKDAEFYSYQGKYEDANRILIEAENSYFVSRAIPAIQMYARYQKWLKDYPNFLGNSDKYQDFLKDLNRAIEILRPIAYCRGIRSNLLLKKIEAAIRRQDPERLSEAVQQDSTHKIIVIGLNSLLSSSFHLALKDPAAALSFLEKMKPPFPPRFHPRINSLLKLFKAHSNTLQDWSELNLHTVQRNSPSLEKIKCWNNALQELESFFSKNVEKREVYQDLQYYKLMISLAQTNNSEQAKALFKESDAGLQRRFSQELVRSIRRLRKAGKHKEAITLQREFNFFKDDKLIQNYGYFFSLLYSSHTQRDFAAGNSGIFEITSSSLLTTDPGIIPFFEEKAGRFSDKEIAQYLWLDPETRISDGMVQKVNEVAVYLKTHGFELKGVKADGNCFCNAFLESYESLSQKIPILDAQENKISYLREMIALQYRATPTGSTVDGINRVQQIKVNGEWLTAHGEGDLLARALSIPIRTITVNQDQGQCGINDMLTFPGKNRDQQEWSTIDKSEKPEKYILIVDLGGHFICAQPVTAEKIGRLSESSLKEDKVKFLTRHFAAELKALDTCIASLETKDKFHQELRVFFSACQVILNLDAGEYATAKNLLVPENTDPKVSAEVAALLFERVYASSKENEKVGRELNRIIANLDSWRHLELFKAFQAYLLPEHSPEALLRHLTSVIAQIEPIEQLSDVASDLHLKRYLPHFKLCLSQRNFTEAKGLLMASKPIQKLYSKLCKTLSMYLINHGEQLRQNTSLKKASETLQALNKFFDISNSDIIPRYIDFLGHLEKIKESKEIAAHEKAIQCLDNVVNQLESNSCPIPVSLEEERVTIRLNTALVAQEAGQLKIALAALRSIKALGKEVEHLDEWILNLQEQNARST